MTWEKFFHRHVSVTRVAAPVLLFLLYTRLSDVYWPRDWFPSLTQVMVGLLFLIVLLRTLVLRRERLGWDRGMGWMLAYAGAIALSSLGTDRPNGPVLEALAYLREVVIVFVLVNLVTTFGQLRLAAWTLVIAGVCLASAAVLHAVTGYNFGGLSGVTVARGFGLSAIRFDGPVRIDSNYFAQILLILVPLALSRAWDERRLVLRLTALGSLALLSAAAARTFSRGGLVTLLAIAGLALVMQGVRPVRLAAIGLALASFTLAAPQLYWSRIAYTTEWVAQRAASTASSRTGSAPSDSRRDRSPSEARPAKSLDRRVKLWQVGALMFLEHPLTGIGKGNYYAAYREYFWRVDANLPAGSLGAHNTPVEIAAETGAIGLAAWIAVLLVSVAGLRDAKRRLARAGRPSEAGLVEGIEIAVYAHLVSGMFLNENIYQRYLWLLIGLAMAARQAAIRQVGSPPPRGEEVAR